MSPRKSLQPYADRRSEVRRCFWRARRFNRLDPLFGDFATPLAFHKYGYAHWDPIQGADPSGLEFSLAGQLAVCSIVGGSLGIGANGVANYSQGLPDFEGAANAYLFGAIAGPLSLLFPVFGLGLASLGIVSSIMNAYQVVGNTNSSDGQVLAALSLVGLSMFGGRAAIRNVSAHGFWYNSSAFSGPSSVQPVARPDSVSTVPQLPNAQPQPFLRSIPRTAQDILTQLLYPQPTPANNGNSTIGGTLTQEFALRQWVTAITRMGAQDIRVVQQQVNAAGLRVGKNQPDLQFTWRGVRYYVEWDTARSGRGVPHGERILSNDPLGRVLLFILG